MRDKLIKVAQAVTAVLAVIMALLVSRYSWAGSVHIAAVGGTLVAVGLDRDVQARGRMLWIGLGAISCVAAIVLWYVK